MNYELHYNKLIERARNRVLESYTERHHVVPKCMGGDDSAENLVDLTPEEHYVAHQLLVKMYPDNHRLVYALNLMSENTQRRSNKTYGWIRRKVSEARKGTEPWNKGKAGIYSEEYKEKIRQANVGKVYSEETLAKISASLTGKKNSAIHNKRISEAKTGVKRAPFSKEWKEKIGAAQRGVAQHKLTCPHCDKEGGISNMKRYHFDNCKVAV